MQPRNGRSGRDGRSMPIVWSWWRCRSCRSGGILARRNDERPFKSAENAPAWANCAILCTDNALMKHCPCSTPASVSPASCPFIFSLLLFLSSFLSHLLFFFWFLRGVRDRHARDTKSERVPWNGEIHAGTKDTRWRPVRRPVICRTCQDSCGGQRSAADILISGRGETTSLCCPSCREGATTN